ncbi:MAG: hypothetical protein DBP01_02670 [gamma proteobacterium symbiont of Ctena orbiculata]|nr:MAG: hypothetical protein DBP01_02670 [gamma proteobacterium symbiont of Ctena orbiculata]
MAENENGQEKTEQPSAKRLLDAKRKGQVPRSRELNSMAVTMIGVTTLVVMSNTIGDGLSQMMSDSEIESGGNKGIQFSMEIDGTREHR